MDRSPARAGTDDPDPVVVHASLRLLLAGALTPLVLTGLGSAALLDGGVRPVPLALVVAGLALGAVVLGDLPRRVEFDRTGLTRVCWLRRQRLPWDEVVALERTAPTTLGAVRDLVDRREGSPPTVSGGLVARGRGRRRWLLTDRIESRAEHDRVAALLADVHPPVRLRAGAPPPDAAPTDLYRRSRRRA